MLIAAEDLPDALFNQTLWERQLAMDLVEWLPEYETHLADSAVAGYVAAYCTYWCALQAALTLPVSLPEEVGDGKNIRKLAQENSSLIEALRTNLSLSKRRVLNKVGGIKATAPKLMTSVGLAVDPVTNS